MATAVAHDSGPVMAARQAGLEQSLIVAIAAVRQAGAIASDRYERVERIMAKSSHDIVTEVDTLAEEAIIASLRRAFPGDRFLAEESGHGPAIATRAAQTDQADARTVSLDRLWIIDPLDGTINYANGIPLFCVSIALAVDGQPRMGVILDPIRDDLFCAVAGGGAYLNGRPIRNPGKEKLSDSVLSLALPSYGFAGRGRAIRKRVRATRNVGSAALALVYVANGRFDAFVQTGGMSLWDVAAAGLIAEEAGARVTDAKGGPWFDIGGGPRSIGVVAAPSDHHSTLVGLLR